MVRLVNIIDDKYVQIEEYRNPNICFNTREYDTFEDYCTLRETFDPFRMFYENKQLKDNWNKLKEYVRKFPAIGYSSLEKVDNIRLSGKLLREDYLLNKMQELEQGSDSNDC